MLLRSEAVSQFLGSLTTVLAAVIAAGAVVWQAQKQFRANLELQRSNARDAIHAGFYRDLDELMQAATHASSRSTAKLASWPSSLGHVPISPENQDKSVGC